MGPHRNDGDSTLVRAAKAGQALVIPRWAWATISVLVLGGAAVTTGLNVAQGKGMEAYCAEMEADIKIQDARIRAVEEAVQEIRRTLPQMRDDMAEVRADVRLLREQRDDERASRRGAPR